MAKRKYRRSADGRFAGGGGGNSTASKGASAKPKAAVAGQKKVAKKAPASTRAQKAIKWAAKNSRKVIAGAYVASVVANGVANRKELKQLSNNVDAAKALRQARDFARKVASDKKGIGSNKPGQGLKAAKKRNGAYKIRSS